MIYIIRAEDTNYYKIGYTENVEKRLKGLQTGCPNNLILIDFFNGNYTHERQIQEHFKQYKIREIGEWFEFSDKAILKQVCTKIKNLYNNDSEGVQNHYKDLINNKIEKYLIEDVITSSKGNEFYISFGKLKETPIKKKIRILKEIAIKKIKESNKNGINEEHNAKQRRWYKWRVRAKKTGVSQMISKRPTPKQREEWKNKIREAEDVAIILKKQKSKKVFA